MGNEANHGYELSAHTVEYLPRLPHQESDLEKGLSPNATRRKVAQVPPTLSGSEANRLCLWSAEV